MKVVDLGTRIGTTLFSFLQRGGRFFPSRRDFISKIQPSECLGVDREEVCRDDLESFGASFECWDLSKAASLEELPEADFYLASKFLHHLPTAEAMDNLVRAVLSKSRQGVWFRLLSFEDDSQTGEGVLLDEDLRFGWSKKYLPYLCKDVVSLVPRDSFNLSLNPARRIRHTNDFRVLPVSADDGKEEYENVMGHKPQIKLVPPVVVEWDLFIERK
jgi:hypothetical protein|tara:strand:- start:622 stop:1269 length:648 start_codon:yes stop_codon:yes gene_type:complete